MSRGLVFWIIMLIWLILGIFGIYSSGFHAVTVGGTLLEFVLFGLLGWQTFGPAVT